MTFTYASPPVTNRDKVRLLLGDTVESKSILSDEELCFLEEEFGSATDIYSTALAGIDVAMVNLARAASSKSVGPLSLSYASRVKDLESARKRIEMLAMRKTGVPTPYAGGISQADKKVDEADEDVNHGHFGVGMFDNPSAADDRDLTSIRDRDRI